MPTKHGLCGKCGVYVITCKVNGKRYIGSSVNMGSRIRQHFGKTCLRKYAKINPFYADIEKYGKDSFIFECLEECSPEQKLETERKWFNRLHPEYNLVEPDENPFKHKEVMEKAQAYWKTPEGQHRRLQTHRTQQCRDKCRESQRKRMISCEAVSPDGVRNAFESMTLAAQWLNRNCKLITIINHIRRAIKTQTMAYGYRWEVVQNEDNS